MHKINNNGRITLRAESVDGKYCTSLTHVVKEESKGEISWIFERWLMSVNPSVDEYDFSFVREDNGILHELHMNNEECVVDFVFHCLTAMTFARATVDTIMDELFA